MRRIDKTKILSFKYKTWLDKKNSKEQKHPDKNEYYKNDVVMNLLYCQKGVCAYTEMFLCDPGLLCEDKWEKGRYKLEKPGRFGELDHFDPNLKKDKFWAWENLFVVCSTINRLKHDKKVDDILKPDLPGYDPIRLLEYEEDTHLFRPHSEIKDKHVTERIQKMIEVLHINHNTVYCEREKYISSMLVHREVNRPFDHFQFFTACQMILDARKEWE